jgi:hypothetical protein
MATYDLKLKGKEKQILEELQHDSIKVVMDRHDIRDRYWFLKWIERHGNLTFEKYAGLAPSQKALFLRKHRNTILGMLELFDEDYVMGLLNIKEDAWDNLMRGLNQPHLSKLTKTDRIELKANSALTLARDIEKRLDKIETRQDCANEDTGELKVKINDLIALFNKFSAQVSNTVASVLVQPLLQQMIQGGCKLEELNLNLQDPLSLDSLSFELPNTPDPEEQPEGPFDTDTPQANKKWGTYLLAHPLAKAPVARNLKARIKRVNGGGGKKQATEKKRKVPTKTL